MSSRIRPQNPYVLVLAAILIAQIGFTYGFARRQEVVPSRLALEKLPFEVGGWKLYQEGVTPQEIRDSLKATDLVSRVYLSPDGARTASLFIAYFQSQRTGVWVHSPKHCMPGTGWVPVSSSVAPIRFPGRPDAVEVNRQVVTKNDLKSVVLYWYEGRGRAYASEYAAKLYLVADAIRLNRTDAALIRIIAPVTDGGEEQAWNSAERFAQALFPALRPFIPGLAAN